MYSPSAGCDICEKPSCRIDRRCPCSSAARRNFCTVRGRYPLEVNIGALTTSFTGLPTIFAAIAARVAGGQVLPLQPKPPPTYGQITRTSAGLMPNKAASVCRVSETPCVAVHTVRRLPSQRAIVACGSIGL